MRASVAEWGARAAVSLYCLASLTSCNIYGPLDFASSDEAHLEAALKCLHEHDYDCAIEEYNQISDNSLKQQKLCVVNLTKAGFTLSMMINTLKQQNDNMLGTLAQALIPWTATKASATAAAQTACTTYSGLAVGTTAANLSVLLETVARTANCAIHMARADLFREDSNGACNLTGDSDGIMEQSDISVDNTGAVSGGNPGMCQEDVQVCSNTIASVSPAALAAAGLPDISSAMSLIPAGVVSGVTNTARGGLHDAVTP